MKTNFYELIQSKQPVLVDFYADWCGPCKMMAPALNEVADKMSGKAKVIKINVDSNPKAAAQYRIQGVPTLMIFQNGQIKWRQSGALSASQLMKALAPFV